MTIFSLQLVPVLLQIIIVPKVLEYYNSLFVHCLRL